MQFTAHQIIKFLIEMTTALTIDWKVLNSNRIEFFEEFDYLVLLVSHCNVTSSYLDGAEAFHIDSESELQAFSSSTFRECVVAVVTLYHFQLEQSSCFFFRTESNSLENQIEKLLQ